MPSADPRRRALTKTLTVTLTHAETPAVRIPGLAAWLERVAPASAHGEVTVAIVNDRAMRALNRQYRQVDAVTDVLSFPADASHHTRDGVLGDIVIAIGVARKQACLAGHALGTEARVLALHGLLHLLGYDHETDHGRMARVESRLRRTGGLREGLIARARSDAS
jgi:probable rRNA maturation factor